MKRKSREEMTIKDITVGVIGASGYTGSDLIRILLSHPKIDLKYVSANNHAGQRINEIFPYLKGNINLLLEKWEDIKKQKNNIKLHLIGKLQSNKVKLAVKIFDFIHSLDSEKLAKKISEEQQKHIIKPKIFIQINLGEESQKSGIKKENLVDFYNFSKDLGLNVIGTMCIPPFEEKSTKFFYEMKNLNEKLGLYELSMGMSSDYLNAVEYKSTYLRIGSNIFGQRS